MAKMPASVKVFSTGMSVFEAPSPVTKSTLASSISFDAPFTASAGLVLSSTTVYFTGTPPSLLPSSSSARSMPRLVSVPAGAIGPAELRQIAELDDVGGLRGGRQRKQHRRGKGYASHRCVPPRVVVSVLYS